MARLINYFELKQRILEERDKIPLEIPAATYELVMKKPNHHGNSIRGGIRIALRCLEQCQTVMDAVYVVRCKDCKHWHEETGWRNHHSHFIGEEGEACHPWESSDWKMLNADDFCSYGERRANV